MEVKAATPGTTPFWAVFALRNPGVVPLEIALSSQFNTIASLTPSHGSAPVREKALSSEASNFTIKIEQGQTVTFVAELGKKTFGGFYLDRVTEAKLEPPSTQPAPQAPNETILPRMEGPKQTAPPAPPVAQQPVPTPPADPRTSPNNRNPTAQPPQEPSPRQNPTAQPPKPKSRERQGEPV